MKDSTDVESCSTGTQLCPRPHWSDFPCVSPLIGWIYLSDGHQLRLLVCDWLSWCQLGASVMESTCSWRFNRKESYFHLPSLCLSLNMFLYFSVSPSLSVRLSACPLPFCLSVCPSVWLSVCPSICPSVCLSLSQPAFLSFCLSVYLYVCLSVCLSVYL